jgi:hypothetical protein
MPTTKQVRPHGDRNVVPDLDPVTTREHGECPVDEFTLPHMRATSPDS